MATKTKLRREPLNISSLIAKAFAEPLSRIPCHANYPGISRAVLMSAKQLPETPIYVAAHSVGRKFAKRSDKAWRYTELHCHDFAELNIIWSETGKLVYRINLGGKVYKVKSPAAVLIPAGVPHQAEAISGRGTFFCIALCGEKHGDTRMFKRVNPPKRKKPATK